MGWKRRKSSSRSRTPSQRAYTHTTTQPLQSQLVLSQQLLRKRGPWGPLTGTHCLRASAFAHLCVCACVLHDGVHFNLHHHWGVTREICTVAFRTSTIRKLPFLRYQGCSCPEHMESTYRVPNPLFLLRCPIISLFLTCFFLLLSVSPRNPSSFL